MSLYIKKEFGEFVQIPFIKGEKGEKGDAGTTPHIGDNGNWFIGDTDTGKPSRGQDGVKTVNGMTPDENGNVEIKIPESSGSSVTIDTTLTQSGQAADAKAVGDALISISAGVVVGRFFGKVANFIGDSITDYAGNYKEKGYEIWLKDLLGLSIVNNYGISGNPLKSFAGRVNSMDANADLIVVFGGTNDYHYGCPVGNYGDTDDSTFFGSLNLLYRALVNRYPNKDILFITPTRRNSVGSAVAPLVDYVDAVIKFCEENAVPVFDAYRKCQCGKYTADGLHLNDVGHEVLAKSLANYILYGEMAGAQSAIETVLPTSVLLDMESANMNIGDTIQLAATIQPSSATSKTISWRSSNASVATVKDGLVTAIAEGTALIYASCVQNKTATCAITVGEGQQEGDGDEGNTETGNVKVSGVLLDKTTLEMTEGDTQRLTAIILPDNATNKNVSWSTNNGNCTVADGLVTAVTAGDCTITVTTEDGNHTASCVVTVSESLADAPESPVDGKTVTFTAAGTYPANHSLLTMLVLADDFGSVTGDVFETTLVFENATQELTAANGFGCFPDTSGSVSNGAYVTEYLTDVKAPTISDNKMIIRHTRDAGKLDADYVKISIPFKPAAYPVSFDVVSLSVKRNNDYIAIQKVGSFYAPEGYSESQ